MRPRHTQSQWIRSCRRKNRLRPTLVQNPAVRYPPVGHPAQTSPFLPSRARATPRAPLRLPLRVSYIPPPSLLIPPVSRSSFHLTHRLGLFRSFQFPPTLVFTSLPRLVASFDRRTKPTFGAFWSRLRSLFHSTLSDSHHSLCVFDRQRHLPPLRQLGFSTSPSFPQWPGAPGTYPTIRPFIPFTTCRAGHTVTLSHCRPPSNNRDLSKSPRQTKR